MNQHPNIVYLPTALQRNEKLLSDRDLEPIKRGELPPSVQGLLGDGKPSHVYPTQWQYVGHREDNELAKELDALVVEPLNVEMEVAGEYLALASLYRLISKDGMVILGLRCCWCFILLVGY